MQAQRAVIAAIEFQPGAPLVQQIVDQLSVAISQGGLPHGAKLPPIRELSELMNVGKSTVVDALDRLRAKGLVVSRQGSGHYVHRASPQPRPLLARICNHKTPSAGSAVQCCWTTARCVPAVDFCPAHGCPPKNCSKRCAAPFARRHCAWANTVRSVVTGRCVRRCG